LGQGKKPEGQTRETRRNSRTFRRDFTVFLILFFALWLFSYLLTIRFPGIVARAQLLVAAELDWCLDRLDYLFTRVDATFTFNTAHGGERLVVIAECTGLYTTIIFYSIILAYPARIREKMIGLLIGIPAIHILNLIRMVVISLVLYHRREMFDFFHGYLWQITFVIFMLMIVIFWMAKIVKPREAG